MKNNRSLRILLFVSTTVTFVFGIFAPFYTLYVVKLGGDIAFAGLSWAAFSIVSGILMLSLTVWENSVKNQKKLYASGHLLRAFVFFSYIFISNMYELIILQVLLGISIALSNPAFDALFTKHTDKKKEVAEWGGWEGLTSLATGAAALFGGYFIENYGFVSIFSIMSLISLLIGIYLISLPKETL